MIEFYENKRDALPIILWDGALFVKKENKGSGKVLPLPGFSGFFVFFCPTDAKTEVLILS